jgi:hypothetical protein
MLKKVLGVLGGHAGYKDLCQPTVTRSELIATSEAKDQFLKVLATKGLFLQTALDINYESCYVHIEYNISRTMRLPETEEYGAPCEARVINTLHIGRDIWHTVPM